jgi:hypothetical protein
MQLMGIRLDQTPQADTRGRWLQPPRLRTLAEEGERHASWLELFFDLVFVVAITELSHYLVTDSVLAAVIYVNERCSGRRSSCPARASRCSWLSRREPILVCEASVRDPRGGGGVRLRGLGTDVMGSAPRRPHRPTSDRRFDRGADPTLRRQPVESGARLLAREERTVRPLLGVPLRAKVPDELLDQQRDRQAFRLLDTVTPLQNRERVIRRHEREASSTARGQEAPSGLRLPALSLPPLGRRSCFRAGHLERPRGFDWVPGPAHRVLRRALLTLSPSDRYALN